MTLERMRMHHIRCPFSGGEWLVQFWKTEDIVRSNAAGYVHRMVVAIWQRKPMFPSNFGLIFTTRDYIPGLVECDGERAARYALDFLEFEDIVPDTLEVGPATEEALGEVFLVRG